MGGRREEGARPEAQVRGALGSHWRAEVGREQVRGCRSRDTEEQKPLWGAERRGRRGGTGLGAPRS